MKIAVIVLTYNRPLALLAVLRALLPQCGGQDQVWVADDGSTEENQHRARVGMAGAGVAVHHVWHPDSGFTAARARNMAAARVQAEYLVFLDGDCVPHPHWLSQHRALAEQGCFVNGSRVLLNPTLTQQVESQAVELSTWGRTQWLAARGRGQCNKLTQLVQWPSLPGRRHRAFQWKGIRSCNFALWRQDFVAVNGFDESFKGWGHEDADLVLRLHNLGLQRKNGHCATEVFHLWHRENDRSLELSNRRLLQDRMEQGLTRAVIGLDRDAGVPNVCVSQWGL